MYPENKAHTNGMMFTNISSVCMWENKEVMKAKINNAFSWYNGLEITLAKYIHCFVSKG